MIERPGNPVRFHSNRTTAAPQPPPRGGAAPQRLLVLLRPWPAPVTRDTPALAASSPAHTAWLPPSCSSYNVSAASMQYCPSTGGAAVADAFPGPGGPLLAAGLGGDCAQRVVQHPAGRTAPGPRGVPLRVRLGTRRSILASLEERDRQLTRALGDGQQVVLWFEHDLYDQLQLVDVLALVYQNRPPLPRRELTRPAAAARRPAAGRSRRTARPAARRRPRRAGPVPPAGRPRG